MKKKLGIDSYDILVGISAVVLVTLFIIFPIMMSLKTLVKSEEKDVQTPKNRFMFTNVEGLPGYVVMEDTETDKEYFIIDNTYGSSIIRID